MYKQQLTDFLGARESLESILALIRMAVKKCIDVRLGVIYDSLATNSKYPWQPIGSREDYLESPLSRRVHCIGRSYLTPSRPEFTKIPPQKGGSSNFLIEKSPKTAYFYI
jgi:hypothetical protein